MRSQIEIYNSALNIVKELSDHSHKCYFCGGYVRDRIMKIPFSDIDLCTFSDLVEIEKVLENNSKYKLFSNTTKSYNILLIHEKETELDFQITKILHEPIFKLLRDSFSRDFTINSIYYDPLLENNLFEPSDNDTYIDFSGGIEDIKNGILRCKNPSLNFKEDPIRMLRGIRFFCDFLFTFEDETWNHIKSMGYLLFNCSGERIENELSKILTRGVADVGFEMLKCSGLLEHILPEISRFYEEDESGNIKYPHPKKHHPEGNIWEHTIFMLRQLPKNCSHELAWSVLLHDVGKPPTYKRILLEDGFEKETFYGHDSVGTEIAKKIMVRLKMPNIFIENVCWLIKNHMKMHRFTTMTYRKRYNLMIDPRFPTLLELNRLDYSGSGNFTEYNKIKEEFENADIEYLTKLGNPLLNGKDLIAMFGISPGPLIGKILNELKSKQISGEIKDKKQAIEFVKNNDFELV